MRHGSLFSGIGGFDLAAEWMGWNNAFHCEINSFCQQVLKKNFPNSICYGDIKTTDFTIWNGAIDIISGGFPCQPYSVSGNRKGKEDERHLWPEMLRAIREVRPRWFVGENVPGLLNWNDGVVLDEIKADLEAAGFEVFPPLVLPACGVNASHRRDRVWIVAYSNKNEHPRSARRHAKEGQRKGVQEWDEVEFIGVADCLRPIADADSKGEREQRREQRMQEAQEQRYDSSGSPAKKLRYSGFRDSLSTPRIFRGDDGIPNGVDRVKSLGNAIVPQVVYQIFKTIEQWENYYQTKQ